MILVTRSRSRFFFSKKSRHQPNDQVSNQNIEVSCARKKRLLDRGTCSILPSSIIATMYLSVFKNNALNWRYHSGRRVPWNVTYIWWRNLWNPQKNFWNFQLLQINDTRYNHQHPDDKDYESSIDRESSVLVNLGFGFY